VVIGGGLIAEQKIPSLFAANAQVHVVAPEATAQIRNWSESGRLSWTAKRFEVMDLEGAFLVIAATRAPGVNALVYRAAESRGLLCNAVDEIEHCHFYYGAVVQRKDLQIAISTNGKSPALAQRLRQELAAQFGDEYGAWLDWLGAARELLRANSSNAEQTRNNLHELASRESFERFCWQSVETRRKEVA
jgi:siroheme synthase-like protein